MIRKEDALLLNTPALKGAVLEDVSVNSVQKKIKKVRCDWLDAAHGLGGTVHSVGMRTVRITDQATWTKWKHDPDSMPVYLLQFISTNKGDESDEMKL